jgi:hypothetical protein
MTQLAHILTPRELRTSLGFVQQLMRNGEIVLAYADADRTQSSEKLRTIQAIRVRLNNQIEVRSNFDRDWRPISLGEIVVQ